MRIRERELPRGPQYAYTIRDYQCNIPGGPWFYNGPGITYYNDTARGWERMSDEVTGYPGYKRRIAAGEIINNRMSLEREEYRPPEAVEFHHRTTRSDNGLHGFSWIGPYIPFANTGEPLPRILDPGDFPDSLWSRKQELIDEAVTQAHANVDASEMLALATAAESRKTIESMASILGRSLRIANNVRKLNIRALRNELKPKELADRYMEARFAVRPLYYDAHGLRAAITREAKRIRHTYRGKSVASESHTDTLYAQRFFHETRVDLNRTVEYKISARAGVLVDVDRSSLNAYGQNKLLETAWELMPFTWLFDYIANVGDTIAAWTPDGGVNHLASWVTVKTTITSTNSLASCYSDAPAFWDIDNFSQCSPFSYGYKKLILERIPGPQLSPLPRIKLRLDGWKLADMAIALRNALKPAPPVEYGRKPTSKWNWK